MDKNNNSGYRNSGDWNSGDWNSSDRNSGNWNSGDWNSGMFNTNEPKMRIFNKDCDLTYTEFRDKFGYKEFDLPLNNWIEKSDMTKEEKEQNPNYDIADGYLKTLEYKEAWKEGWSNATEEQKEWFKNLPNFSSGIFLEITGIDIKEKEEMIEIDGKKLSKSTILEAVRKYVK